MRLFNPNTDYDLYASWWPQGAPPKDSLPVSGVNIDDKAMGFLALTDCDFSIITWYMIDPKLKPREKYKLIKKVFVALLGLAKLAGKNYAFCFTNNRAIIRMLESLNFYQIERGHMAVKVV